MKTRRWRIQFLMDAGFGDAAIMWGRKTTLKTNELLKQMYDNVPLASGSSGKQPCHKRRWRIVVIAALPQGSGLTGRINGPAQ
jgi:hypothetical protein